MHRSLSPWTRKHNNGDIKQTTGGIRYTRWGSLADTLT